MTEGLLIDDGISRLEDSRTNAWVPPDIYSDYRVDGIFTVRHLDGS